MPYQYVREPLPADEADQRTNPCETPTEPLIVWTLLETGLHVSERCALTTNDVLWQQCQIRVGNKGGPSEFALIFSFFRTTSGNTT